MSCFSHCSGDGVSGGGSSTASLGGIRYQSMLSAPFRSNRLSGNKGHLGGIKGAARQRGLVSSQDASARGDTGGLFRFFSSAEPTHISVDPDSLLANGMNKLSLRERDKALDDLHGVGEAIMETPELVAAGLRDIQVEINKLPAANRRAYDLAAKQSREFVSNPKFLLLFLRADEFQTDKAANRLARFFEEKLEYFGEGRLTKRITLNDMDEDDIECIQSGLWQVLPHRDRSGRKILMCIPKLRGDKTNRNKMRAYYYICMSAVNESMESESESEFGDSFLIDRSSRENASPLERSAHHQFIHIFYHMVRSKLDQNHVQCLGRMRCALPMLFKSDHLVFNNPILKPLFSTGIMALDLFGRVRVRMHCGTEIEAKYNLMGFGIPIGALPISFNGEIQLESHQRWFIAQSQKERQLEPFDSFLSKETSTLCTDDDSADAHSLSPLQTVSRFSGDCANRQEDYESVSRPTSVISQGLSMPIQNFMEVDLLSADLKMPSVSAAKPIHLVASSASASTSTFSAITPTDNDVLFGRGKPNQNHPGNVRYRSILDELSDAYDAAERFEKSKISKTIVRRIKEASGRFVKQDKDGVWFEVDESTARVKIGHAFRTRRRAVVRAQNNGTA